ALDHFNYWKAGYPAIMVSDTSFLRNPNYHKPSDTIETLNFDKMAAVVQGVFAAVLDLAT
ncbi:MAG: M28 family peptidase, partial [Microscillaceae bacterium]|nr:M28 family peptidase [Microscillaceae bacterium]